MKILWIFSDKIDVSLLILIKLSRKLGVVTTPFMRKTFRLSWKLPLRLSLTLFLNLLSACSKDFLQMLSFIALQETFLMAQLSQNSNIDFLNSFKLETSFKKGTILDQHCAFKKQRGKCVSFFFVSRKILFSFFCLEHMSYF